MKKAAGKRLHSRASVNVPLLTRSPVSHGLERGAGHHAAFNVPTRSPVPPRARPPRLPLSALLPKGKVSGGSLVPRADAQRAFPLGHELSIAHPFRQELSVHMPFLAVERLGNKNTCVCIVVKKLVRCPRRRRRGFYYEPATLASGGLPNYDYTEKTMFSR